MKRIVACLSILLFITLVFKFSSFAEETVVFGPQQFERVKGKPVDSNVVFFCSSIDSEYKLIVKNGTENSESRVSSATITINSNQVVTPSDFNQQVEIIEKSVQLSPNNEISVHLSGKPGSLITLSIISLSSTPPFAPTANINVNPATIVKGESATLSWSAKGADVVTIEPGIGIVASSGSINVAPIETTTYIIQAINNAGTSNEHILLSVVDSNLPPDPGEAGLGTLAGIDSDGDGVRDDVQRHIALTYSDSIKTQKALTQQAIAFQNMVMSFGNKTNAIKSAHDNNRATTCLFYIRPTDFSEISSKLKSVILNTHARSKAYVEADCLLSGEIFTLVPVEERKGCCDFNPDDFQN